jgi:DNA (cytosine-5)-methyltransferase 1
MSESQFTAISLFSGLGGDTLGMTQSGCHVVAYNELKPTFCNSHNANFPDSELIHDGKVHDISKLKDEMFVKYAEKTDIIFAGFPCQGFSNAGKKKDDDPRNTMFLEFLRATKLIKPNMFIGENVKGLLSRKTSNSELYIDIIVSEFDKIGYDVIYRVFKCEEYGVPQKRERLIILGIKRDNSLNWKPSFPDSRHSKPNLKNIIQYNMTGSIKVSSELFETIPDECILTDDNDTTEYADNNNAHPYLVSKMFANESERTYNKKTYDCLFSFAKRDSPIHCEMIDIRKPSKTIICTYEHQPRLFVPLKNPSGCYLRMLLPDELKQIQGFPADYIVCGNIKEQIIQIGNAVPPPLIKALVENIITKSK